MPTLIYKRTHPGDPDREGRFGIHGCMGQVRTWRFEAVIGVGGIGARPRKHKLDRKVNWIGIGAHKTVGADPRGPVVTFDHFLLFPSELDRHGYGSRSEGSGGPWLKDLAPRLADRIYSNNVRVLMNDLNEVERREVKKILALAKNVAPSSADAAGPATTSEGCAPRTRPAKSIKGCSSSPAPRPAARTNR